ncbi:MarR family winged helix-turn-helix transcriptional regulator [Arthrobacter sp. ISL-95]|uniref:MarR family winged helix-turn-helix transcriptional regulator n=1 Tax=Arthrobacter sp. ISL-95 TaxID=2819116 RepID=UPI001BE57835|nr:MarR family transcriptional regulator [Arthrobacter sp. ISL-95]MBT2587142.1 MarR family transcriptional regulator [Arthrobacter sp. ISL-95]
MRSFFDALRPLRRRLDAERTMSPGKLGVVSRFVEQGQAASSELGAVAQVSPQAISSAVGELERLEFVERVPDEEDRRRTWTILTVEGRRKLVQELAAEHAWLDRAVAERLTPEGRKALEAIPVLSKLGPEVSVD